MAQIAPSPLPQWWAGVVVFLSFPLAVAGSLRDLLRGEILGEGSVLVALFCGGGDPF